MVERRANNQQIVGSNPGGDKLKGDIQYSPSWVIVANFGRLWTESAEFWICWSWDHPGRFLILGPKIFINKKRDFWNNSAIFGLIELIFGMEVPWDSPELSSLMYRVGPVKLVLLLLAKNRFSGAQLGPNWAQSDQNHL